MPNDARRASRRQGTRRVADRYRPGERSLDRRGRTNPARCPRAAVCRAPAAPLQLHAAPARRRGSGVDGTSGALVTLAPQRSSDEPAADRGDERTAGHAGEFADSQYDQAIGDLERTLEAGRNRLDPETIRVIEENLRAIDLAIDQARRRCARTLRACI